MPFRKTVAAIIACLALPAAAEFVTVALAYEIALNNFSAPSSPNGAAIFRECNSCASHSVRVTASTEYRINDEPVTLEEFRKRLFPISKRADETVIVVRRLASDTIEQILIDF